MDGILRQHWAIWFVYVNTGILMFLALAALARVAFGPREDEGPPAKEIMHDDEFRGEVWPRVEAMMPRWSLLPIFSRRTQFAANLDAVNC
jgi:hypothetical protein